MGDKNFGTASFQLEPGKYKVVVLAHSSNGNPSMTDYKKIQFKNDYGFTDTFLCYDSVEIGDTPVNLPANPKRIVSLCRFVISDTIPSDVSRMRFLYTGGSGSLDATTGLGCVKSRQNEFFDVEPGTAPTTFDLYTFLHGDEGTIHLQATAYDEEDNVLTDREFDIPLKRRKGSRMGRGRRNKLLSTGSIAYFYYRAEDVIRRIAGVVILGEGSLRVVAFQSHRR